MVGKMSDKDRAVIETMRDLKLKPGQMLLLGPRSVAMLSGDEEYNGVLPDRYIFEPEEWKGSEHG